MFSWKTRYRWRGPLPERCARLRRGGQPGRVLRPGAHARLSLSPGSPDRAVVKFLEFNSRPRHPGGIRPRNRLRGQPRRRAPDGGRLETRRHPRSEHANRHPKPGYPHRINKPRRHRLETRRSPEAAHLGAALAGWDVLEGGISAQNVIEAFRELEGDDMRDAEKEALAEAASMTKRAFSAE